jgi:hypothetical protein
MADRVLREFPGNDTSERFPLFRFKGHRAFLRHAINPYFVILAAEIKFRRYLAANGPELPQDCKSLIEKTIEVAELLYFQPAGPLPALYHPFEGDMAAFHTEAKFDDAEMGFRTRSNNESGGSTARQERRPAAGGGGTRRVDADHWRHMLSGRGKFHFSYCALIDTEYSLVDLELNDDDLDVLCEIEESNRGEQHSQLGVDSSSLTLHSHLESQSIDLDTLAHIT